jgi:DNA-binding MarR family transcriptional regulator
VSTATPYPEPDGTRTAGWSGSEASHDRAIEERDNGTVTERQKWVLGYLMVFGSHGLTVQEVREESGWHHGQASSTLSVLHKEGRIARLKERRNRCHVYVLPQYVNDREVQPHGRKKRNPLTDYQTAVLRSVSLDLTQGLAPRKREVQVLVDILKGQVDG